MGLTKRKLLLCALLIAALCSAALLPSIAFASNNNNFDSTNVLDDLKSSTVNGTAFDAVKYPYIPTGANPQLITLSEYCYSPYVNQRDNYGIYIYVYVPSAKPLKDSGHTVQLAVSYDANGRGNDYQQFALILMSRSPSNGSPSDIFYKFKVVDAKSPIDNKTILQRLNETQRLYDISGFTLRYKDGTADEYGVGGRYTYTGNASGYGYDNSMPLTCTVTDIETVKLEITPTTFRSASYNTNGKYHRWQLSSVFFDVDNRLFEQYGALNRIKAEWYEYKTQPFIVANYALYSALSPHVGHIVGSYNKDVPFSLCTNMELTGGYQSAYYSYDWTYNIEPGIFYAPSYSESHTTKNYSPTLTAVFKDNLLGNISSIAVSEQIYNYNSSYHTGTIALPGRSLSADLFTDTVDNGRTRGYNSKVFDAAEEFDMLSYDSNHSGWDKFFSLFWQWSIDTATEYTNLSPIYIVTDQDMAQSDSQLSESLCIGLDTVWDFRYQYTANKVAGKKTVILRAAQTDYYSAPLYISGGTKDMDGYMFSQTVLLDLDVLWLSFLREGQDTVIPAVSKPIDIIGSGEKPLEPVYNFWDIIKTIIMAVCLIAIVVLVIKLAYAIRTERAINSVNKIAKQNKHNKK